VSAEALPGATLTITRDAPDDVQDRWIRIYIDDAEAEILRYGDVMTRPIAAGHHHLKAHNTLSSHRIEFEAAPGETVHVRCFNTIARGGALMMLTIGFAFIKVRLELVRA
jgi:hypothetical protein